jgi:hypothetical protein
MENTMQTPQEKIDLSSTYVELNLSIQEVNLILSGLGELPARISFELIEKLRNQALEKVRSLENSEESE